MKKALPVAATEAIATLAQLIHASGEVVKQEHRPRGLTKGAVARERAAIARAFQMLTGRQPTDAEISEITD